MNLRHDWFITLLKRHGVSDVKVLESPEVNEEDLIFVMHRNRLKVPEEFFKDLAKELALPFIGKGQVKSELAATMPYSLLKENLVIPLEISTDNVKIVTSNPLNRKFFSELERTFGSKVELHVASVEAIEEALEQGYEEIHKHRALRELHYRSPDESAYRVLYPWQRYLIIGLLLFVLIVFVVNYPASFILVFLVINVIYFCVNPAKFYVSFRGFKGSRRAVHVSEGEVKKLDENSLPLCTILIPVYREAKILPHILENISKLDYPKDKLDVKILMEEKDKETLSEAERLGLLNGRKERHSPLYCFRCGRMLVPKAIYCDRCGTPVTDEVITSSEQFFRIFDAVIVPDADIKTKPRACNYGLLKAKGEYCVIYDAEDDPEPDQLKKAAIAFSRAGKDCVCLQSRLNFYNPKKNLLTRWFSLEYSYWFDYYLEGLDHVGAPIPLGGTSNHFRTEELRKLGGWDPYNVTEDADLGVRISRRKLKTVMLDSYTFEEANSRLWNWVRQRSRWNKGYVQTYLVHMRHPRKVIKDMGWRQFFFFQLTFGGNIFLPLVNPLLWAVTLLTLLIPGVFQFLFFYPIAYVCIFNLVVGNLVYILLHLGPYILKKNYTSIPLAIIIPLYWILISIGAWRGTTQLITRPFYWEKTEHGLSELRSRALK